MTLEDEIRAFLIRHGIQEKVLTDTIRVYRDGKMVGKTNNVWGTNVGSAPDFRLTASPDGGGYDKYITDNIKVWNYAKTDFSDRFSEGVSSPNCLLWNKLDGQSGGTIYSEVGDNATITNNIAFEPSEFNNGVVRKDTGSSVDFPPNTLWQLKDRGCVEFWLTPKVAQPIPYQYGAWGLINGPYIANGEVVLYWGDTVTGNGLVGGLAFGGWASTPNEDAQWVAIPFQNYHIAMTWDRNGIDGFRYITLVEMLREFWLIDLGMPTSSELTNEDIETLWLQTKSGITNTDSSEDLWYRWQAPIYGYDKTIVDLQMFYYINN